MQVSIETMHCLRFNGSPEWKVTTDLIRVIEGENFVKLRPYDQGLIRMMCHNLIELPKKNYKMSLSQCDSFKSLMRLRQDAVAEKAAEGSSGKESLTRSLCTARPVCKHSVAM